MADHLYLSHILAIYGCVSNSGVFFFSVLALPTNLYPEALWLHKITCNWVKLNIEIFLLRYANQDGYSSSTSLVYRI